MSNLDPLLRRLFDDKADVLAFATNQPALLVVKGERSAVTPALSDHRVREIAAELMPPDVRATLDLTQQAECIRRVPVGTIKIIARKNGAALQLMITRVASANTDPFGVPAAYGQPAPRSGEGAAARSSSGPSLAAPSQPPAPSPFPSQPPAPAPFSTPSPAAPFAPPAAASARPAPVAGPKPIDCYFRILVERGGSDLYLCTGKKPLIRKDGDLVAVEDRVLTEPDVKALLYAITEDDDRESFERENDLDFAYEIQGLARFRANLFRDRLGVAGIFRQIPVEIRTAEELGVPQAVLDLCMLNKGLVLVTGPTGSGKSTTLAAMIDTINRKRSAHLITIEDPIEFVHQDKRCVINQREVGSHTGGFKRALRAALREDPDIVLVGEMRDLETVAIAIETAETGHLVFGTLHTNTAASTVDRIIDQFPADQQAQIRTMLSEALKGVISQTLLKKKGGGRVAALEVLLVTHSVSNLIRESKTFQIPSVMQTSRQLGMTTLNDSIAELVQQGQVTAEEAMTKTLDKADMKQRLARLNINVPASL